MKKVIDHFERRMMAGNVISKDETAVVRYGLEVFFISFLELAAIFVLAAFVGNLASTVCFFLAFIPLRLFAGGFHASTRLRCFVLSLSVYCVFTVIMQMIPTSWYTKLVYGLLLVTGYIIWRFSPSIHRNRRSNEYDRQFYHRISLKIWFFESIMIAVFQALLPISTVGIALTLGMFSEALALLVVVLDKYMSSVCQ